MCWLAWVHTCCCGSWAWLLQQVVLDGRSPRVWTCIPDHTFILLGNLHPPALHRGARLPIQPCGLASVDSALGVLKWGQCSRAPREYGFIQLALMFVCC